MAIPYRWRDDFTAGEANALHADAWLQDVIVAGHAGRQGVGTALVAAARDGARAAGCEWLHVDYDDACGFTPTNGGLIQL
jgi:GNAT superfamily N-acetyltransferase